MKILFKFATRSRPDKLFGCLDNIVTQINEKDNYQILISADMDDKSMSWQNIKARWEKVRENKRVLLCFGASKNKVHAYNRDIEKADQDWEILINTSDDMWFSASGFDDTIRKNMAETFPDGDGFLHYNDGNQRDNVCTLAIMGRKYYDRFGYIYHPSYTSLWCDNEQTDVAKILKRYRYLGDKNILFKHLHPAWGRGQMDELYARNESRDNWDKDEKNYKDRKKINFGL